MAAEVFLVSGDEQVAEGRLQDGPGIAVPAIHLQPLTFQELHQQLAHATQFSGNLPVCCHDDLYLQAGNLRLRC